MVIGQKEKINKEMNEDEFEDHLIPDKTLRFYIDNDGKIGSMQDCVTSFFDKNIEMVDGYGPLKTTNRNSIRMSFNMNSFSIIINDQYIHANEKLGSNTYSNIVLIHRAINKAYDKLKKHMNKDDSLCYYLANATIQSMKVTTTVPSKFIQDINFKYIPETLSSRKFDCPLDGF